MTEFAVAADPRSFGAVVGLGVVIILKIIKVNVLDTSWLCKQMRFFHVVLAPLLRW